MANKSVGKGKLPVDNDELQRMRSQLEFGQRDVKRKANIETEEEQRLRFQVELEFVQCLANPNYLHFLAQRGFFKDSSFINYLKYLLYWKEPDYAKYLKYPMCLYFLDLLQYEHFRREIVNAQCCKFIDDQVILLWQHYTRRRTRLLSIGGGGVAASIVPSESTNQVSINQQQNGTTVAQQNGIKAEAS